MAITSKFTDDLLIGDVDMADSTPVSNLEAVTAFKFEVPKKQIISFGKNNIGQINDLRGDFVFEPKDTTPAAIPGDVTIRYADANQVNKPFVRRFLTEACTASSPLKMAEGGKEVILNPKTDIFQAKEDSFLLVEFRARASGANPISKADSVVQVPVTRTTLA